MPYLISPQRLDPTAPKGRQVFLAGSIEMGKAEDWQSALAQRLLAVDPSLVVANPRRSQWDASWEQSIHHDRFKEQVDWELDHIESSDLVIFYLQPNTYSPITLLELGKHLARNDAVTSTLVCCPPGFWRKGNVDIVCARVGVDWAVEDLETLTQAAEAWVRSGLAA